jgi:thioredoxin reductase (NADPH)
MTYDSIIIGMGIAGISAAIYAKRSGNNVLMLEKMRPGGIINTIDKIENYPGFKSITGPDLAFQLFEQVNELKIPYKMEEVIEVTLENNIKVVKTKDHEYRALNILIATGRSPILLGLPKEEELIGKGISTCALCDGYLYKEKEIAVVGGGNSALQEALYLSNIVKKIYLIHRRDEFRADSSLVEQIKTKENIEICYTSQVTSLEEENGELKAVVLNETEKIPVSAMFVYIGYAPKTDFVKDLGITNQAGYLEVNENYETKVPGIYGAGDIIVKKVYQIVTAASEGATAAIRFSRKK